VSWRRRHLKEICESCGFVPEHERQLELHHLDRDRSNNDPSNLQTLCSNCHSLTHAAESRLAQSSSEQQAILAQLRALKRRRVAAQTEEQYRRKEMARRLDELVRAGRNAGLQPAEMYRAAGTKEVARKNVERVPTSPSSSSQGKVLSRVNAFTAREELAEQLKALAEPARLAIIDRLARLEDSSVEPFCDYLQLSQPTVSHHLKILRRAGVIEVAGTSGPSTHYRLVPKKIKQIATALGALYAPTGLRHVA
jgi:DNA-binding transcriptional ArsR family regulator